MMGHYENDERTFTWYSVQLVLSPYRESLCMPCMIERTVFLFVQIYWLDWWKSLGRNKICMREVLCVGYHFQFTPIWIACKHKIIKFMPQNSCLFNACVDNDRVNTMRKIVWAISIDLNTGDIFLLAIHIHWYITCIRYMITSYRSTLQRAPKWMSRKKGKVLYDSIIMKMWTHSNCWYQI